MATIWCHPFSTLFFSTAKDLWWKKFLSRPQLAGAPQRVNKHLLKPSLPYPPLPTLPGWGTILVISEIFSWIFSLLWLCGPFITSLHSEWFTACLFLSSQSWESLEQASAFHQWWRPGFWASDSHFIWRTWPLTAEEIFMALSTNQEGGWIGSGRSILHERNEFCPVWDISLIKGKTKLSCAGFWRKVLAKVSLVVFFLPHLSQLETLPDDGTIELFSVPWCVCRLLKEQNPSIVSFTWCICRSLEQGEELTFTEPHLIVGGATVFSAVHSSHMVPFLSFLAPHSLGGIAAHSLVSSPHSTLCVETPLSHISRSRDHGRRMVIFSVFQLCLKAGQVSVSL